MIYLREKNWSAWRCLSEKAFRCNIYFRNSVELEQMLDILLLIQPFDSEVELSHLIQSLTTAIFL